MNSELFDSFKKKYTEFVFIHYYQQIKNVLKLKPARVLEIGPGDYTVSAFLRRMGVMVKTFDINPNTGPDYLGDVRQELKIEERFDLVLASEVFEHMNIEWLEKILQNIKKVIVQDGWMVVSLPYSTIRFFPESKNRGRFISCEGRLQTYIPVYVYNCLRPAVLLRAIYRIIVKKSSLRGAFKDNAPELPDDKLDCHHWDLGWSPFIINTLRKSFTKHFIIYEEKRYMNTGAIFFILKKKAELDEVQK
jgi:SAM-dependent methyltransferase